MKPIGNVLVLALAVCCMCVACNHEEPQNTENHEDVVLEEITPVVEQIKNNALKINEINEIATAKLMVESREISKEELPEEIYSLTDLPIPEKLSLLSAYYTKSDYSSDEFDVLHDYVLLFSSETSERSVKISVSSEGNPLRDYFFNTTKDPSIINDVTMIISHYEDRYIVTFSKNDYSFDVETSKFTETELLELLEVLINN